jgi:hypothetical protein
VSSAPTGRKFLSHKIDKCEGLGACKASENWIMKTIFGIIKLVERNQIASPKYESDVRSSQSDDMPAQSVGRNEHILRQDRR